MAIGPESGEKVSGRVVVIAGAFFAAGGISLLFGAGPLIEPSDFLTRGAGVVAMTAGAVMLAGGIGLLWRGSVGRALGIAGGAGATVLALTVASSAVGSLNGCAGHVTGETSCQIVVLVVAGIALAFGLLAIAAVRVIRRVPGRYWRRGGR